MEKLRKTNGITLVALIITIVVLVILAGVSISTLVGNGGIIKNANKTVGMYNNKSKEEQNLLNQYNEGMEEQLYVEYWDGEVNKPNIKEGMIPVKWNGTNWIKADASNVGHDWYNYNESDKKWANVVTVKESGTKTREYYKNAETDTIINMDDITTMFVWIPRYAYKITSGYHENAKGTGNIEIEWLKGKTSITATGNSIVEYNKTTTENYTKFPDGYVVHPAFASNTDMGGVGEELTGFWVGKFEASNYKMAEEYENNKGLSNESDDYLLLGQGDEKNVTIKPNVTSWRNIDVPSIYNVCQNMAKTNNIHGLGADTTTVMMQNSQWGAVAYLAQSKYGNKQSTDESSGIWSNSYNEGFTKILEDTNQVTTYSTNMTGIAGISRDDYTSHYARMIANSKSENSENGSITMSFNYGNSKGTYETDSNGNITVYTKTYYRYNTEIGQRASTTRNIYGVYDMSGGAWEYMANYLKNVQKNDDDYPYDYVDIMNSLKSKYITGYLGTSNARNENYNENRHMYGDAVWETSNGGEYQHGWNGDYSYFPCLMYPFFNHGGCFSTNGGYVGVFFFSTVYGGASTTVGFRVVAI